MGTSMKQYLSEQYVLELYMYDKLMPMRYTKGRAIEDVNRAKKYVQS